MVTPYVNTPAEARDEAKRKRKGRRNAIIVIAILNVLVLVDGISGTSDLRRISTPQGAAAAWADAAVAADCDTYIDLEGGGRLASDLAGIALGPTVKTLQGGLCQRVGEAWLGVTVKTSDVVAKAADVAVVRLTVTGVKGGALTGEVLMRHDHGRWRVALPPKQCARPAYSPEASLCSAIALPTT